MAHRSGDVLGRMGRLVVRLAEGDEVRAAQALRHAVFHVECGARGGGAVRAGDAEGLDRDDFDAACDHLIVVAPEDGPAAMRVDGGHVVATYRMLPAARGRLYTAGEFDLAPLLARHPSRHFLELGRSCVARAWRTRRTVELLWHGTWAYVLREGFDTLFGCASLPGTDVERLAAPLAWLREHARAPEGWRVRGHDGVPLPERALSGDEARRAWRTLPPILKGYLRLGAQVGEDAVVDRDFGTTDVLVILRREAIAERYLRHYGEDASRYAA